MFRCNQSTGSSILMLPRKVVQDCMYTINHLVIHVHIYNTRVHSINGIYFCLHIWKTDHAFTVQSNLSFLKRFNAHQLRIIHG